MKKNHSKQLSLNNYSFDFKTALNNKDLNIDNNIKNIKSNVPKINRLNLRFSNNFNKPNNNNIINTSINTNKKNHKDYRQIDHIKTLYSKINSKDVVKEKLSKKYISNNYNKKDHINNLYSSTNNNNNNEINEIEEKAYFSRKKKIDVDKLFKKRKVETQKKFFGNSLRNVTKIRRVIFLLQLLQSKPLLYLKQSLCNLYLVLPIEDFLCEKTLQTSQEAVCRITLCIFQGKSLRCQEKLRIYFPPFLCLLIFLRDYLCSQNG